MPVPGVPRHFVSVKGWRRVIKVVIGNGLGAPIAYDDFVIGTVIVGISYFIAVKGRFYAKRHLFCRVSIPQVDSVNYKMNWRYPAAGIDDFIHMGPVRNLFTV